MGIAALSTEEFGGAIQHRARYKKLSAPEEILHEKDDKEWSIQFRWTLAVDVGHKHSSSIASPGYSQLRVMGAVHVSLR